MSKSLGNFFTVRELLEQGVPGEVIRFVFLSTHYRKPMDWTEKKREEAEKVLRHWRKIAGDAMPGVVDELVVQPMLDDLNSVWTIQRLRTMATAIERGIQTPEGDVTRENFLATAQLLGLLTNELGGWDVKPDVDFSQIEDQFLEIRKEAMKTKDFSDVDRLKTSLADAGVEVRMSKDSVKLVATSQFDLSKLEALK